MSTTDSRKLRVDSKALEANRVRTGECVLVSRIALSGL